MIDIIMFSCHFWQPRCQKYVATFADSVGTQFSIQNFALTLDMEIPLRKKNLQSIKFCFQIHQNQQLSRFATIGNLCKKQ